MCVQSLQSCLTLQPCGLEPARLLCLWDFSGKNTGVGCQALLQGIFPTQGSDPHVLCLLHCGQISYHQATGEALLIPLHVIYLILTASSYCANREGN